MKLSKKRILITSTLLMVLPVIAAGDMVGGFEVGRKTKLDRLAREEIRMDRMGFLLATYKVNQEQGIEDPTLEEFVKKITSGKAKDNELALHVSRLVYEEQIRESREGQERIGELLEVISKQKEIIRRQEEMIRELREAAESAGRFYEDRPLFTPERGDGTDAHVFHDGA